MTWQEAESKLSAKNASIIRAALGKSINAKQIVAAYMLTQPEPSDNPTLDRAKARAWAIMNVRFDNDALLAALVKTWSEGYVLGNDAAGSMIAKAIRNEKAAKKKPSVLAPNYDWGSWVAGDDAAALLISKPKAFAQILNTAGLVLKGLDRTTIERIGTALASSVRLGLSPARTAKALMVHVADPARALTIAITETNRVISAATMARYADAGLDQHEWLTSDPCPICAMNDGEKVMIGEMFPSGDEAPPAHPNCRCSLLPVIEGFDDPTRGSMHIME